MAKVEIIVPGHSAGELLSDELRRLTEGICAKLDRDEGYGLGGEFGYGTDYENDVFMMHRFCWCERDDCPWCGGCKEEFGSAEHTADCYQSHLVPLKEQFGERREWGYYVPMFTDAYDRYVEAKQELCARLGIEFTLYDYLCTCDGEENFRRKVNSCQCDWHLGKGPFKYGAANQAPNFWHKPSGLRVWWYKWIGRDEVVSGDPSNITAIVNECLKSVEAPR